MGNLSLNQYHMIQTQVSTARMRHTPAQDASCSCVFRLLKKRTGTLSLALGLRRLQNAALMKQHPTPGFLRLAGFRS